MLTNSKQREKNRNKKNNNCNIYVIFTFFLVLKVSRFALTPQTRLSAPNKVSYVASVIISLWLGVQRVRSMCLQGVQVAVKEEGWMVIVID